METNVRETFLHIFVKFVFCGDDDECLLRLIELWQWIRLFCGYFHVIHDHYFIFPFFFKDKFCIGYWNACQWKNWNYYAFEIRVFLCKLSQAYIRCILRIAYWVLKQTLLLAPNINVDHGVTMIFELYKCA